MGRELRRVPLDFKWPENKPWEGFVNPHYAAAKKCACCAGGGYSPEARELSDRWYGYGKKPFDPKDRGSVAFEPDNPVIMAKASRNAKGSSAGFGALEREARREAQRLCGLYNQSWNHHLNDDDVKALVDEGRLMDFTHDWAKGKGWTLKSPAVVPTAAEVNLWSIQGMGHDGINQWVVVRAECKRLGIETECSECKGEGIVWPSPQAKEAYEGWKAQDPPKGDGFQMWETVSEGSPISPVFDSAEGLAKWLSTPGNGWGSDQGSAYENWLSFIRGPGWTPSMVMVGGKVLSGVDAMEALETSEGKPDNAAADPAEPGKKGIALKSKGIRNP